MIFAKNPIICDRHKVQFFHKTSAGTDTSKLTTFSEFDQQLDDNKTPEKYDWSKYNTLNQTYNWLTDFQKHHAGEIEILTIGKTAEGRPIKAVKVVLKGSKTRY